MSRGRSSTRNAKGKSQDVNWEDWANRFCVAEPGWEEEPKKVWDCTTCRKYVKMTHLCKIWPRERVELQVRRWEGQMTSCMSEHFKIRYEEITGASNLPVSKPNIMNYSNMAMIWAEIVLHKEVDWRTLTGRNVAHLTRHQAMIDTNWTGASDCLPEWSNRGQFGFPPVVLPDAEDESLEDDEADDTPATATSVERHERQDDRANIEYEQQMREAMRRSVEDVGRQHGHGWSNQRDRADRARQDGGGSSHYGNNPQGGSQSGGGSYGSTHYTGSTYGDFQNYPTYPGSGAYGSYGHQGSSHYSGSGQQGSQQNAPIPPPTFGGSYYGNSGQGGAASGYGYHYGGGPYIGIQSRRSDEGDDSSSDEE